MTISFRRLIDRLLYCLISLCVAVFAAHAAGPQTVTVNEALFGSKSGNDKKEAALSFVSAALSLTDAVAAKDVVDVDKFHDGLEKIIDGTVECLNASSWAKRSS